jgi:hypothetical protein
MAVAHLTEVPKPNKITFDGYKLKSPISIVLTVCSFLKFWAGLYREDDTGATCARRDQIVEADTELAGASFRDSAQEDVVPRLYCVIL